MKFYFDEEFESSRFAPIIERSPLRRSKNLVSRLLFERVPKAALRQ